MIRRKPGEDPAPTEEDVEISLEGSLSCMSSTGLIMRG